MACHCNCFGIAAASKVGHVDEDQGGRGVDGARSRARADPPRCFLVPPSLQVPVKRYNTLVPDIFPVAPPKFGPPPDAAAARKLGKLGEYLACNPHRAPKASRRLARKAAAELKRGRLGYVGLAAAAYQALLARLPPRDGALLGRELAAGPPAKNGGPVPPSLTRPHAHSVIGLLLRHPRADVAALGAGLLSAFADRGADADAGPSLDALVVDACDVARGGRPGGVAVASSFPASSDAAARVAALGAARSYVSYCARASRVPTSLEAVAGAALDVLVEGGDGEEGGDGAAAASTPLSSPHLAARLLLVDVMALTKDSADGARVAGALLGALDARCAWRPAGAPLRAALADAVDTACGAAPQRYVVFSELVRHAARGAGRRGAGPAAPWGDRAATLAAAGRQGTALGPALASPALALLLRELPPAMADECDGGGGSVAEEVGGGGGAPPRAEFWAEAERLCGAVAARAGDAARLMEALSAGLGPAAVAAAGGPPRTGSGAPAAALPRLPSSPPPADPLRAAAVRRAALACAAAAARGAAAAGVVAAGGRASGLPRALAGALLAAAADGGDVAARRSALAALASLLGGGAPPSGRSPRRGAPTTITPSPPRTPRAPGAPPPPTAERVRDAHARAAAAVAFLAAEDAATAGDVALCARVLAAAADHAPPRGRAAADLAALPLALLDGAAAGDAGAPARALLAAAAGAAAAAAAGASLTLPGTALQALASACPQLRLEAGGLAASDPGAALAPAPLPPAALADLRAALAAGLLPAGPYALPADLDPKAAAAAAAAGTPPPAPPPRAPSSGGASAAAAAGGRRPAPPGLESVVEAAAAARGRGHAARAPTPLAGALAALRARGAPGPAAPAVLPARGGVLALAAGVGGVGGWGVQ